MARYRIDITHSARTQVQTISRWWQKNATNNPSLFREELTAARNRLSQFPNAGPMYVSPEHQDVRRILLLRTQFHLYYVIDEDQFVVTIVAVWHTSRGSGPPL